MLTLCKLELAQLPYSSCAAAPAAIRPSTVIKNSTLVLDLTNIPHLDLANIWSHNCEANIKSACIEVEAISICVFLSAPPSIDITQH
jgi:hypothetical protein